MAAQVLAETSPSRWREKSRTMSGQPPAEGLAAASPRAAMRGPSASRSFPRSATAAHPTAIVAPGAKLADDVEIGPYTIIGEHVEIGAGTTVGAHAVITGHTTIGARNQIFHFVSLGEAPQDPPGGG